MLLEHAFTFYCIAQATTTFLVLILDKRPAQ